MASKLIQCKTCGADIAASAKMCPHCGARNTTLVYRQLGALLLTVVLLAIFIAVRIALNGTPATTTARPAATPTTQPPKTAFTIGERITTKSFEITVDAVGLVDEVGIGGQYLTATPAEGGIYVTLDVSYKNISGEPISAFKTPSFYLIDPSGVKYASDLNASFYYALERNPDKKTFSDLNPGITVNDNLVFEVAAELFGDSEGWKIRVDADKDYEVALP